jgi:hypothetical protein
MISPSRVNHRRRASTPASQSMRCHSCRDRWVVRPIGRRGRIPGTTSGRSGAPVHLRWRRRLGSLAAPRQRPLGLQQRAGHDAPPCETPRSPQLPRGLAQAQGPGAPQITLACRSRVLGRPRRHAAVCWGAAWRGAFDSRGPRPSGAGSSSRSVGPTRPPTRSPHSPSHTALTDTC